MYIVEDFQDNLILIRKFNTKLRQKLYQAYPEELIHVSPSQNIADANQPALTPAGRPLRNAAKKAFNLSTVSTLDSPSKKKPPFKPGWLPEDQSFEDDVQLITLPTPHPTTSSIASTIGHTSSDALSDDTDRDLSWDSSPEQYSLTPPQPYVDTAQSVPSSPQPPVRPSRSRRFAVSDDTLARSDAFRDPADLLPSRPTIRSRTFFRSRIPRPSSTTDVNLHQVNDISLLPQPPMHPYQLRTTAQRRSRQETYGHFPKQGEQDGKKKK